VIRLNCTIKRTVIMHNTYLFFLSTIPMPNEFTSRRVLVSISKNHLPPLFHVYTKASISNYRFHSFVTSSFDTIINHSLYHILSMINLLQTIHKFGVLRSRGGWETRPAKPLLRRKTKAAAQRSEYSTYLPL
jgi:hypothetical protein